MRLAMATALVIRLSPDRKSTFNATFRAGQMERALDRTTMDEVQRVPDLLRAIKKSVDDVAGPAGFC
jgi:hypothetical protein